MLSVEKNYSRLFRPWDVSEKEDVEPKTNVSCELNKKENETKARRRRINEDKRQNRLRKIRGTFKRTEGNVHQDATVSTTTTDADDETQTETDNAVNSEALELVSNSPVAKLSMCCDRLLPKEEEKIPKSRKNTQETTSFNTPPTNTYSAPVFSSVAPMNIYNSPSMPEYMSHDIAQALGVPSTDPLLLESLAQGYAMELEYARILQQENEAKLLNARKQRPKKYKCPHCHVGFSNNGQLKGHIRIHTGERPYKCDEKNCGKTFTRNEELTRHKRIHSGVRPFPCPTCGKKFGRRDHLKKHTRTHFLQAERMMPVFVPLSAIPQVGGFPYLYGY